MNTRLSILTSVGAVAVALVGLTPACGSDGSKPGGGILDGGGATTGAGGGGNATGGASNTGTGGGVSTGTGGGSAASTTPLGQACLKDTDCGTQGLTCLLPAGTEFDGGGAPNGLCTVDCSAFFNAVSTVTAANPCTMIDPNAICLGVSSTQAYCAESCTVGPVPTTEIKCHGRKDMACTDPQQLGTGFCQPTCRGDFDCAGKTCDLSTGVCTGPITADRNLPAGAKCDPNVATDSCEGRCIGVLENDSSTAVIGFCSGFCKLGEVGCGVDPTSKAKVESYCLFGTEQNSDLGDLGFCAQLCDCNDDCNDPDFICSTVTGLAAQVSRTGACGPKSAAAATQPNGIACTTKPKPTADSGKPTTTPPAVDAGAPDAG